MWKINQYTISFDSVGGSKVDDLALDYNESVIEPVNPKKIGYTFVGWNQKLPETMPAKDIKLIAVWKVIKDSKPNDINDIISPIFKTDISKTTKTNGKSKVVVTGVERNLGLYVTAVIVSLGGLFIFIRNHKNKS